VHTVGLVGLGNMGSGMAGNFLAAGYPLVVHDVRPDVVRGFAARGARAAGSLVELARLADVTLTSLPGPPEVEAVATGPGGLLEGMRKGCVWVDTSTSRPTLIAREFARAAHGIIETVRRLVGAR
jgi:3-hydroxyisobutyrate dehydrogenase